LSQTPFGPPNQPQYGSYSVVPQQGASFGWGPQFSPGPPKKRSKGPVFAILGLVVLAGAGLWAFGVIKKNADDNVTRPTVRPTMQRNTPTTGVPTEEPTTRPTATRTTTYKPSKPQLTDNQIVQQNKLYRTGKQRSVNCKEPNIRPSNNRAAAAYWARVKPCLDRAWAPYVRSAGYQFRAPQMSYWSGSVVTTPCSSGAKSVPFYCSANEMMYMKVDVFAEVYNEYPDALTKAYARMWYTRSIAHEYGHHLQYLTGILEASYNRRYEASTSAGVLLETRRMELQANCLAGVFLAANKRSYPINGNLLTAWNRWVVTAGDPPGRGTHGSTASQKRYMGKSFVTGNLASCNTFSAPARLVD
jgi:predicted metalloprotease